MRFSFTGYLLMTIIWVTIAAGQNGRFAVLKSQALSLFGQSRYAEAGGKLEEIWEQDQSDLQVDQYLAMSYLYGEHDARKAAPVLEKVQALGGPEIFLIEHSHEKLSMINGGTMNQYCTGRFLISPGKMEFIPDSSDHAVLFTPSDLKEFKLSKVGNGRIDIKGAGKAYHFRVKSETHDEAALLQHFAEANLKR